MRSGPAVVSLAILAALLLAPQAGAKARARPDLVVARGAVAEQAGVLRGTFVVRNAGRARARASSASLIIRVGGRNRVARRFAVRALARGSSATVRVAVPTPGGLTAGTPLPLRACADGRSAVRERSERNNCRTVGRLELPAPLPPAKPVTPAPAPAPAPAPVAPGPPASSVPTNPIAFSKDTVFRVDGPAATYWAYVPGAYDASHRTPIALLVWLHGCGGQGEGDIYTVSPGGAQRYLAIAVGGREGDCWQVGTDTATVLAAIADVKSHFNVDPRRVVLGGYSSGGDLAYRTAYENAALVAGVLAENTAPFRDTGRGRDDAIAATGGRRFHVAHLAHTGDAEYPIATVRDEIGALQGAGFPVAYEERPGAHYDGATDAELQSILLPHMDDGWLSP